MNKTILVFVLSYSVSGVNMHAGESDVRLHHAQEVAQQVVPTPQEPDENTRRKAARAELLPFLHNDVISLVLAYAAKSWNECARDKQWSWLEPDVEQNKKRRLNNGNSVQTCDEAAWLAGLGYVYEDHEKIPLYKQLADACVLRHMGRVTGLVDSRSRSVYLDPKTQTIDKPTYKLPDMIPNYCCTLSAVMSASGKKMVVRTHATSWLSRLDSYALDQDKGTLTKDAFSSPEGNDYQCLAVSDKRVVLGDSHNVVLDYERHKIIIRDETRELCTIPHWHPYQAAFMGNRLLVVTTCHADHGFKLLFIDTSRTVPAGSNRIIGMTDYASPWEDERDLAACTETGRIFITTGNYRPKTTTSVLQLGVGSSD